MTTELETHLLTLPLGQIKGIKTQSIYDDDYYSFEGIPYGKPPLGELRFRAPEPAESWAGVKDCTNFAIKPVQKNILTGIIEGSEDCLYLNVYSKSLKSDKPLPVMIYIYGGGFTMGEATRTDYSPDFFMHKDIVLVTFNYRVCSLGFLSLSDAELAVPGNAGLKDQVLALKWVKKYIRYFNGDSDNITVFGESAGGASTHYMMTTEQTRGLFHKAIVMSGSILNSWASMSMTDMAYRLAKYHGYDGANNDRAVLTYLRTLDANKLVDHAIMNDEDRRNKLLFTFVPVIEPYVGEDCVISGSLIEMLKTAWTNELPMMIGGTSMEGLVLYPNLKLFPQSMNELKHDPERILPVHVRESNSAEKRKELSEKLIKLHFGDEVPSDEMLFKYLELYGYKMFWHGVHRTILSRLAYGNGPTYLYRFDFDSPDYNHYRTKFCGQDPIRGAAHADDLSYLWFADHSWKVAIDSAEYTTIRRMVGMWTSFAKTSNPNCKEIEPIVWQPLEADNAYKALNISYDVTIMDLPEKPKLEVWNSLYKTEDLY